MHHNKIHIVGGGIGGLTLANAFQAKGVPFELYEQASILTEVGAGIGLSRAPIFILEQLGLGNDLRKSGAVSTKVILPDKKLRIRRQMEIPGEAICIHRAKLIDILKKNLPDKYIHLSKKATGVVQENGKNRILFADDTEVEADCVIAADGISSPIRKSLIPKIRVRYINQVIWRGISEVEVPEQYQNAFLEIWDENKRFLTIPIDDKHSFWLAVKREPPGGRDNPASIQKDLHILFRNFHPFCLKLIDKSGPILRYDMGDLGTKPRPWFKGSVAFMGDAIHATTPNLAQGGCQAIEDAWCLSHVLEKYGTDYQTAFSKYQQLRQKKVMDIVSTSWTFGKAAHSRNPLFHYAYRLILTHAPRFFMLRQEKKLSDLSYMDRI